MNSNQLTNEYLNELIKKNIFKDFGEWNKNDFHFLLSLLHYPSYINLALIVLVNLKNWIVYSNGDFFYPLDKVQDILDKYCLKNDVFEKIKNKENIKLNIHKKVDNNQELNTNVGNGNENENEIENGNGNGNENDIYNEYYDDLLNNDLFNYFNIKNINFIKYFIFIFIFIVFFIVINSFSSSNRIKYQSDMTNYENTLNFDKINELLNENFLDNMNNNQMNNNQMNNNQMNNNQMNNNQMNDNQMNNKNNDYKNANSNDINSIFNLNLNSLLEKINSNYNFKESFVKNILKKMINFIA